MTTIKKVINNWCCYNVGESPDNTAYWSSWSWSCKAPTQNTVYTKLQWVKEFNPSNTWNNWQILQKTSNWYAWCNNSSSWAVIKPTNRVRCYICRTNTTEQSYTIPSDWIINMYACHRRDTSWSDYVYIYNWSTCVGWIYTGSWSVSWIETVRAWYVIKARETEHNDYWNWSFTFISY